MPVRLIRAVVSLKIGFRRVVLKRFRNPGGISLYVSSRLRSLPPRLLLRCAGEDGGVEVHHHLHGRLWGPGVEGEVQKGQSDVENPVFQVGDGFVAHQ